MISAEQIKAARALLRLEQEELARRAGVSISTIRRMEAAFNTGLVAEATVGTVRNALEEAGVEFIHEGVVYRKTKTRDQAALYSKLRAIAERSAAEQPADALLTDTELYGEDGLPS